MIRSIAFILLFSCATVEKNIPINSKNIKKYLGAACLTSEGKGRVEIGSDQFVFDFGSMQERDTWMLGVDVPLRGEEDLQIQKIKKGFRFKGSFYSQLSAGYQQLLKKDKNYKKDYLNKFLSFMGQNIFILNDFTKKKNSWFESYFKNGCGSAPVQKCTFKYKGRTFEVTSNSLKVVKKLEEFDLSWSFQGYSNELGGYFEKSQLLLKKGRKPVMGVHFFHDSCQSETSSL